MGQLGLRPGLGATSAVALERAQDVAAACCRRGSEALREADAAGRLREALLVAAPGHAKRLSTGAWALGSQWWAQCARLLPAQQQVVVAPRITEVDEDLLLVD